jgi:very-short-patch-repair endonuclease
MWRTVAAEQHGAISRPQLLSSDETPGTIRTLLDRGELMVATPGVYRLGGAPGSWKQDLFLAHLAAGSDSVISHRSAGVEWGLDAVQSTIVEVSSPRKLRNVPFQPHRTLSLTSEDVSTRGSLPITTPTRTLLDLSSVLSVLSLEQAYESALRKGLTHPEQLEQRFERWARSGRTGVRKWRELLSARSLGEKPTESYLETLLVQAVRRGQLSPPVRQHSIEKGHRHVRRFDFAYPAQKLAIEADSAAWHLGRQGWRKDLAIQNEAASLGWLILRFTFWDLTERPEWVIATIVQALHQRRSA